MPRPDRPAPKKGNGLPEAGNPRPSEKGPEPKPADPRQGGPARAQKRRVSIIDDDESVLELLSTVLRFHGFAVDSFTTAGKFLDGLSKCKPDLLLLDLEWPGLGGWEFLKTMKENPELRAIPVILITGRYRSTKDVVRGLQLGADDYMTQPIQPEFLLARIEAILRRTSWKGADSAPETNLRAGPVVVDPDAHRVQVGGADVHLTHLEFDLLVYLLKHQNRVLTRGLVLEKVWKGDATMTTRTVDKHIEALRKKLGDFGRKIETVVGVGYVLRS